ncbi:peptidase S41 [Synechococcus sp. 63AY4M2]|nr:peptidase family S41, nonpeptidase-like protein [Synechococcus sp. JA-3-3Ab]PIK86240.1 peptidase S41 [Synechococcus sp. 63AY4M2]PIK91597.1 peptidase S41 [Synechococcus sp. 65AY6Li]
MPRVYPIHSICKQGQATMKGFARAVQVWGTVGALSGVLSGRVMGQAALPPVPVMPSVEDPIANPISPFQGASPDLGIPAAPPLPAMGQDLRYLVELFINESWQAGKQAAAVNYNDLYTRLLARTYSDPRPPIEVEYELIREVLREYGDPADRFWDPQSFRDLLNRPRPPLQARQIGPRQVYLAVPELTPATAQQIRQALYTQDYSQGIVLDLRSSVGYDPQVIADVARLFLPRSVQPLLVTEDRFGQPTPWNSENLPLAAGIPSAVLVDGNTRQGATLLAAQLGASGSTVIVGQPTQGSERQTRFFALPSGAAVELAVATWKTGDGRSLAQGLVPLQKVEGDENAWLKAALEALALPRRPSPPPRPTVLVQEGRVGRFVLGMDTRNVDTHLLGNVDLIPAESRANVFQPNSDLKIFYLQDYILFAYRRPGVLNSFFADRIYTTQPEAMTGEGIRIGSTYSEVIAIYGGPGENGYNEVVPYPKGSREYLRDDRYYVNYDALGLSFAFAAGSNQVTAIGLFKPGS